MGKIDLLRILKEVAADVLDEYRDGDENQFTAAEAVETLGLLSKRLAGEPAMADWAGPLELAADGLITLAVRMGEDGQ